MFDVDSMNDEKSNEIEETDTAKLNETRLTWRRIDFFLSSSDDDSLVLLFSTFCS